MDNSDLNNLGGLLLRNAKVNLCVINSFGNIVYINDYASKFLGYKPKEVLGKNIHDIVHGKSKTIHEKKSCVLTSVFDNKKTILREPDLFYNKLGEGHWVDFSTYLLNHKGESEYAVITFFDASVALRSKQIMSEHQAKFKAVFVQALYPKFILDNTGEVLEANPAALKLLGKKDIENTLLFELFTTHSEKKLKDFWKDVREKKLRSSRLDLTLKNKKKLILDLTVSRDIQPNMNLLTAVDVTKEYMRLEAQSKFISVASHELKTPLAVIRAYSELLERKYPDNVVANSYVSKIKDKVDILTQLINAMVDEIKLGTGKLEFHNQKVDFDYYLNNCVNELKKQYKENPILIKGKINSSITIDPDRVSQVINNLISNAAKHSKNGKKIILNLSRDDKNIIVSVKDYGSGIHKEEQASLFKAFYRSEDSEKKKYPGLGLGLFISKQIVNHYGGDMWAVSKWKKGSTFSFTLPIT